MDGRLTLISHITLKTPYCIQAVFREKVQLIATLKPNEPRKKIQGNPYNLLLTSSQFLPFLVSQLAGDTELPLEIAGMCQGLM